MCGFTGLFQPQQANRRVFDQGSVLAMNQAIHHRGPDEGGIHLEPGVALGHRRLSIIDIATGQQPLFNEDKSVVVVYNGEIYNFQELTRELSQLGHQFETHSDTEVIVHAWEQWGAECVTRFRGMFAFAVWDRNRQTLFMARDRLGVKPLFYAQCHDGTLAFASELKALTILKSFPRALNERAIEEYFAFGYIPDPATIYSGASKLSPGHWLTWTVGDKSPTIRCYWDARFQPDNRVSIDDSVQELDNKLREVVDIRMISEVPLGAFLSGGIDSGAVVSYMAELSQDPVKTCSIGFDVSEFDESQYAKMVADRYRTTHFCEQVSSDDFALAQKIANLYDEPFADSSALPTYRVCELARKHVTVALSGDGGDETFGGYRRYRLHVNEERVRSLIPSGIRRSVFGPLGRFYPKLDWAPQPLRGKTTFQSMAMDSVQAYFNSMSQIRDADRTMLLTPEFRSRLDNYNAIEVFRRHAEQIDTADPLTLVQYLDYKTYLPGDINTKVDRASMAHSLEVREPLMDHHLVEWMATLPSSLKLRQGNSKFLLKSATRSRLPSEILDRRKMGFAVPLGKWFRGSTGDQLITAIRNGPAVSEGFINPKSIESIFRQHRDGTREWSTALWMTYCFDQFMRSREIAGSIDI